MTTQLVGSLLSWISYLQLWCLILEFMAKSYLTLHRYMISIMFRSDSDDSMGVDFDGLQTTSKRLADRKIEKFDKNITKRGFVPETTTKKGKDYPVGPILLGFFVFVVIGSSLFQIIRTATSGGMA
ncbi:unnamed protein product [Brassica napus]|uniref:(rape) hypothetical protein n=1 Tax=Brassica napus TaxID=3708 RepID=A0A816L096_BRANA|nr:unnamed protein product [Brassica napus]